MILLGFPIMPAMNERQNDEKTSQSKCAAVLCSVSVGLLWLAQPPLGWWPAAFVALLPWLFLAEETSRWTRKTVFIAWVVSATYFMLSMQGLRHAHPLMIFPAVALSGYLAVYHVLFVVLLGLPCGSVIGWLLPHPSSGSDWSACAITS